MGRSYHTAGMAGLYEPAGKLKAPVTATILSGLTAAVTLTAADVDYIQIERLTSSAGVLQFVAADGDVDTAAYECTAAAPFSGWMPCSDRSWTLKASGGNVGYRIWQIGR